MYINKNFQILSEYPLWVVDENQTPQRCQMDYNNMEIIRVLLPDKTIRDYPIEKEVTLVPPLGLIFFRKEEDAYRFSKIIDSNDGLETVLFNVEQSSRQSNLNEEFNGKIKEGVYCIPYFDEALADWMWLKEIRWLNSNMDIKKPIPVTDDIKSKFTQYMTLHDIETNTDFSKERLLFEVVTENNKTYINYFKIKDSLATDQPIYFTRNKQFPLFCGKEDAYWYRHGIESGTIKKYDFIKDIQRNVGYALKCNREEMMKKELLKQLFEIGKDLVIKNAKDLLEFSSKIMKKLKNLKKA